MYLEDLIKEQTEALARLTAAVDSLREELKAGRAPDAPAPEPAPAPSPAPEAAAAPEPVPAPEPEPVTETQLKQAALDAAARNGREFLVNALHKFAVEKVTELMPDQYQAFVDKLKEAA